MTKYKIGDRALIKPNGDSPESPESLETIVKIIIEVTKETTITKYQSAQGVEFSDDEVIGIAVVHTKKPPVKRKKKSVSEKEKV